MALSPRELEVLAHVARGGPTKVIAATLAPKITDQSVKSHMANIFAKLQAADRAHAIVLAHRTGQLSLECHWEQYIASAVAYQEMKRGGDTIMRRRST